MCFDFCDYACVFTAKRTAKIIFHETKVERRISRFADCENFVRIQNEKLLCNDV